MLDYSDMDMEATVISQQATIASLEQRNKELEGFRLEAFRLETLLAQADAEARDARADKAALEQEVRLAGAQKAAKRRNRLVVLVPSWLGFIFMQGFLPMFVIFYVGSPRGFSFLLIIFPITGQFLQQLPARAVDKRLINMETLGKMVLAYLPFRLPLWGAAIIPNLFESTRSQPEAIAYMFIGATGTLMLFMTLYPLLVPSFRETFGSANKLGVLAIWRIVFGWAAKRAGSRITVALLMTLTGGLYYPSIHKTALVDACDFHLPPRVAVDRMRRQMRCMLGLVTPISYIIQATLWFAYATEAQLLPPGFNAAAATPEEVALEVYISRRELVGWMGVAAWFCFMGTVLNAPCFRRRVTAFLSRLGSAGDNGRAAGVAALVGKRDPQEVLVLARRTFMALPWAALSESDFTDNQDSGLNAKAKRCRLGEIDAFLSHSWHDDPFDKWRALSAWVAAFSRNSGREPAVWLDKVR